MSMLHTDEKQKQTHNTMSGNRILKCKGRVWPTKIPWDTYTLLTELLGLENIEIDLSRESNLRIHNELFLLY